MTKKEGVDRRRARRVRPRATTVEYGPATLLSFFLRSTTSGTLPLVNLSRTGCQFLSRDPLEEDAKLRVNLKPGGLSPISLTAHVSWCKPVPGKGVFRIGARFAGLSSKVSQSLALVLAVGGLKALDATPVPRRN